MKVEDAEILFKSKINWCAVYSENKIYCVEPGCNYFTTIDNEELKHHMKDVHGYGIIHAITITVIMLPVRR